MVIDNRNKSLKKSIYEKLELADELLICSPFISENDLLFDILKRDIKFTLICRLSHPAKPELFEKIYQFIDNNKKVYVYDDNTLHAKIYYFKKGGKGVCAFIGSSNFTESGLAYHKEVNVLIENELEVIEDYFIFLFKNGYNYLDDKVIEYYKTFYKKPEINFRYKEVKIIDNYLNEYESILNRYNIAKGLLKRYNKTEIPFTYLFDAFCHYFITKIVKDYKLTPFVNFQKTELSKYFNTFIDKYLFDNEIKERAERYKNWTKLKNNLKSIDEVFLRNMLLKIHSIAYGSGQGVRRKEVEIMNKKHLIDLLDFIINNDLSMSQKYSIALTNRKNKGLKIRYLGNSAIGEIPGWLMPEQYPIINSKLKDVLNFFKL